MNEPLEMGLHTLGVVVMAARFRSIHFHRAMWLCRSDEDGMFGQAPALGLHFFPQM